VGWSARVRVWLRWWSAEVFDGKVKVFFSPFLGESLRVLLYIIFSDRAPLVGFWDSRYDVDQEAGSCGSSLFLSV